MKLRVLLIPEEEGGFSAIVPALKGCCSQGETLEETLAHVKEAAEGWLQVAAEREMQLRQTTPEARVAEIEL